jgi:hypothetical protein
MAHHSTETSKKACNFPAISLRSYRSSLIAEISETDKAGKDGSPRQQAIMKTVMAIDKLYGEHQDIDGCSTCWWTGTSICGGLF